MSFANERFLVMKYFAFGGTGTGASALDPVALADGDLATIEAGWTVTSAMVVVTTAITGTTQLDLGDDDDPNGFVAAATLTVAASLNSGAYLDNAGDDLAKYYPAAKTLKLDNTTTSTAGAGYVVLEGVKG